MKKNIRLAIALKYDQDQGPAPVVIASGRNETADRILAKAKEANVPVYHDDSMAQILSELEMGTEIPPELYQAVAQIIAFVWQIDNKYSNRDGKRE